MSLWSTKSFEKFSTSKKKKEIFVSILFRKSFGQKIFLNPQHKEKIFNTRKLHSQEIHSCANLLNTIQIHTDVRNHNQSMIPQNIYQINSPL